MLRAGHYGLGLASYAPFAFFFVVTQNIPLLILGGALCLGFATLPDADTSTRLVKHRGWTHTVWFLGVAGLLYWVAIEFVVYSLPAHPIVTQVFALQNVIVLGLVAIAAVCSHFAGDIITPRGLRLFHPVLPREIGGFVVSERKVSLDWTRASNTAANSLAVGLGIGFLGTAVIIGLVIADALAGTGTATGPPGLLWL